MTHVHLLDRLIGPVPPPLRTAAELAAVEATPYLDRIRPQSTYEALQLGAAADPGAAAIQFLKKADPGETPLTISYAQFMARVTQSANLFGDLGVGPNDVVSLLLPLVPQAFFALFGAQAAGIANPVNPLLAREQITEILRAANTKVLVALGPLPGSDIWNKVQRIKDDLPNLKAIVVVHGVHGTADEANVVYSFDALIDRYPADRLTSGRRIAAHETAGYFHTGGTTGTPRLVRHTHGNQVYQAWAMGLMLPVGSGQTLLFGLPLFHVGGALTQGLAPLALGGTLVVVAPAGWREPNAIRNVWRLVERYRPAVFGGVPTVLAAALGVPVAGADVSSIRIASGGGSAIPVAVGRAYTEQFHVPVLEVYGMTETSSVLTMSYPDRPVRLGSAGHAVPYSRVRIVKLDAEGRYLGDCAANEIGVVAMAGPGVFSGYLSESHNHGAFVEPGWVNSGDLGRLDDEGYLWLTGRAKDLIIRGGHNIDPLAIEEVFFRHPAVALAAVVGEPDAYAGELPVAFVQLKPDAKIDAAELLDYVRERTPERAAVPAHLYFIDPLPLTAVGKVFKPALRWDATRRAVSRMLADLQPPGGSLTVEVGAHAAHGSLITVAIKGVAEPARALLAQQVHERLNPLVMRHEVV
ncbi:acyl-CoA synthetase [Polaromonas sp. C04]|uniref:acyl-CoA synthetase n=1 Tax=Polaromonas sp. C04 TaxID=1945857 RepID=UPI0009846F79|nr:acyl-CoA synthetase [Polaromonas sp. C04]OOG54930.1 acyl-CoA synthetase [Polaromonas sp. C04]